VNRLNVAPQQTRVARPRAIQGMLEAIVRSIRALIMVWSGSHDRMPQVEEGSCQQATLVLR
jgi:hypothetical protein